MTSPLRPFFRAAAAMALMRAAVPLLLLLLLILAPGGAFAQMPEGYREVGKVKAREAKEIESSNWSIGCETLDRDLADYSQYKSYLGPLGAKAVRLQGGWAKTEPERGVYRWEWLDAIVDDAVAQGVQPWLQLSYGNPVWPEGGGSTLGDPLPKSQEALNAWDAWVRGAVTRYKDRVKTWEIWNEPDLGKTVPAEEYAAFYIRTAELVRSIQPEAKLYALGLSHNAEYAEVLLKALSDQGRLPLVDAITFHGYPQNPDDLKLYLKLKPIVAKYGAKVDLIQGETGAPSAPTTGALSKFQWTETQQAKWNLRRLLTHLNVGVKMNLFTLSEFIYNDARRKGLNAKGLLAITPERKVKHVKQAYYAAQHVFSIFDSTVTPSAGFSGTSTLDLPLAINGYAKAGSGVSIVAVWTSGTQPAESSDFKRGDFTLTNALFKAPVCVDLLTGTIWEFPAGSWSQEGNKAVFRGVPVYDSPILIADRSALPIKDKDKDKDEVKQP